MSRLNFNSILSWIDSHIIDYPTAMIIPKNTRILILVLLVSLYLLLFVSPLFGIILLIFFTLYLLYNNRYRNIFFIWGIFFFIWYLSFTACLVGYDKAIWIGYIGINDYLEETIDLSRFISSRYPLNSIRGNFCAQTVLLLGWLSNQVGFSFYIPSLFTPIKVICTILKSFLGGGRSSAQCAPEKDTEGEPFYSGPPSPSTPFPSSNNRWGTKPPWSEYPSDTGIKEKKYTLGSPTPSFKTKLKSLFGYSKTFDPDACSELKKRMDRNKKLGEYAKWETCVVDGRKVVYGEGGFWNKTSICINSSASADDILVEKLLREYREYEKNKKKS